MNCLQARRELLASPLPHSDERAAHLADCADCAKFAERMKRLDRDIQEAVLVPAPEGLADRILLARRSRPKWIYAIAAVLLGALAPLAWMLPTAIDAIDFAGTAEVVGPAHPGVAAISLIADEDPGILNAATDGNPQEIEASLKRLGLTLGVSKAHTYYVGKCHMAGGECDHILLSSPDGYANILLLPDHPAARRQLVTDRSMIALVNSAPHGVYVVVTQSPKLARRTDRLFRRG